MHAATMLNLIPTVATQESREHMEKLKNRKDVIGVAVASLAQMDRKIMKLHDYTTLRYPDIICDNPHDDEQGRSVDSVPCSNNFAGRNIPAASGGHHITTADQEHRPSGGLSRCEVISEAKKLYSEHQILLLAVWEAGLSAFEIMPDHHTAREISMIAIRLRYSRQDVCTHSSPKQESRFRDFDMEKSIKMVCDAEDWIRLLLARKTMAQLEEKEKFLMGDLVDWRQLNTAEHRLCDFAFNRELKTIIATTTNNMLCNE